MTVSELISKLREAQDVAERAGIQGIAVTIGTGENSSPMPLLRVTMFAPEGVDKSRCRITLHS